MAPARVIADSDDSDDDFDLEDGPAKPPTPKKSSEGRSSDPVSAATGSTDPQVFQEIYNDQRAPATDDILTHHDHFSVPHGAVCSSASDGIKAATKKDDTNTSSLTSITDPTMGSNRAKKAKRPEIVDLTQVTTPGRSANDTPKDMWDVPSSPAEQPTAPIATLAKNKTPTSNKRKRVNNVEFTSPLAIEMPSQGSTQPFDVTPVGRANFSLPQAAKKQRIDAPVSSAATDDIDMVVPLDDGSVLVNSPISGQKQVSLYIEPRALTASQQLQYEYHSVDPSPDDQRPPPSRHFTTLQAAARSSGATTIAYSTPSQTRVRGMLQESFVDDTNSRTAFEAVQEIREVIDPEATIEIQSSPDIISAAPVRKKRSQHRDESPQAAALHVADDWNSDDIGFPREMYKPRPSRRRGSDASRQSDNGNATFTTVPEADMGPAAQLIERAAPPASPLKPKKRGRPRKSDAAAAPEPAETQAPSPGVAPAVLSEVAESPAAAEPTSAATQQTKKKRGRPRKSDKVVAAHVQQEPVDQPAAVEPADEAKNISVPVDLEPAGDNQLEKTSRSTKPKKSDKKRSTEEVTGKGPASETTSEAGEARALQPTTANSGLKPGSDGSGPQSTATEGEAAVVTPQKNEVKKEVAGKVDGKQGFPTPASQAGKPLYRVGLSKKSKIAPLLKIVRK
ncbi:hypothetical protein CGCSCA1_v003746 [Colletotrichum siamense]|nr:hypothetical protein CGCSCA1_v003746 [Colletotrichum siamense]